MKKLVFFGSIGIARKILEEIVLKKEVELLGVCCEPVINSWRNEKSVYEYAKENNIKVLNFSEIESLELDLGISVRYNKIIPKAVIDSFKLGIVNTHGGILPEYRGSYCNINAILNGESEFGVTLHYIDKGVDSGDIIDIKKTKIENDQTGFDLYKISEEFCYELIKENIDELIEGTNKRITQQELIDAGHIAKEYKAKKTLEKKCIDGIYDSNEIIRIVRAFDSPQHEPSYFTMNGKRIYLRYNF